MLTACVLACIFTHSQLVMERNYGTGYACKDAAVACCYANVNNSFKGCMFTPTKLGGEGGDSAFYSLGLMFIFRMYT